MTGDAYLYIGLIFSLAYVVGVAHWAVFVAGRDGIDWTAIGYAVGLALGGVFLVTLAWPVVVPVVAIFGGMLWIRKRKDTLEEEKNNGI